MQTTAQLRNAAAQAEARCDWRAAADLYQRTIDTYPTHHPGSALAAADLDSLQRRARSCRTMVASSEDLCGFGKEAA